MNPYIPIIFIIFFCFIVGAVMSALAAFLGPKNKTKIKQQVFECGIPEIPTNDRVSVKYYLTAIMFILFDIETVFLVLWAKIFRPLGWFGIAEMGVFMIILLCGYYYVIKSKALEWE